MGIQQTFDAALAGGPIYEDAAYKYFGEAEPGTALTSGTWRVSRMNKTTLQIEWVDGNGEFDNVFTSLVVVAALTYS